MDTKTYTITHFINGGETIEERDYEATSVSEALTMAERAEAGQRTVTFGIQPRDYDEALAEGVAFNEADGLLVDAHE